MTYLDDIQDQQSGADDPSNSGLRPETTDYLNNLAGIGTQAYLAMRDPDLPEYEDWRDSNFVPEDSGSYVSREGQPYSDDELQHMHGFLSRQAGNPFVSGLFDGPDSPLADYMVWRNQNFSNDNGPWEDEDGNLYSEQALQGMFADKFAAEPDDSSDDSSEESGQNAQASAPAAGQSATQSAPGQQQPPPLGNRMSDLAESLKQTADYMKWRDQNYRQRDDGTWEGPDARIYTNDDLKAIYEIRNKQWPKSQAQSAQPAPGKNDQTVTLIYPNGMQERRMGNHPQRDNNPGDIEWGDFAKSHGGIGNDKGMATFPSSEAGWAAMDANLKSDKYWNLSIDQAIRNWAPPKNAKGQVINPTAKYQASVRSALGVPGSTTVSSLTPQQFETLKRAIAQFEGFYDQRWGQKVDIIVVPPRPPNKIPRME